MTFATFDQNDEEIWTDQQKDNYKDKNKYKDKDNKVGKLSLLGDLTPATVFLSPLILTYVRESQENPAFFFHRKIELNGGIPHHQFSPMRGSTKRTQPVFAHKKAVPLE